MKIVLTILAAFVTIWGIGLLLAWPTVWLVNYLFTAQLLVFVLGAAKITFWKAFCINALFGSWFKSSSSSSKSDA